MIKIPLTIRAQPSPVARRVLLHLFSIGRADFDRQWSVGAFEKPGAAITWVKSGQGSLRLDDCAYDLKPDGGFLCYGTGQPRVFSPTGTKVLVAHSFWFGGPGLEGWLEELDICRRPLFRLRNPERINDAFIAMLKLVRRRPPNWEWDVHLLLTTVLGELMQSRALLHGGPAALPQPIAKVLNAIETRPERDWKAAELASVAGISYSAFRALFREALNESPHEYLQRVRADLARDLLSNPALRIKEIAHQLHFSTEHYFSAFFHKHVGLSPTRFREVFLKSRTDI